MVGSIFRRGEIYYIAYCISGKQIKESTKQSKYKVAKEMLANIEAEISQGKTPYSAFRNATFEDLVELIKADYMKRGRKSWDTTEIRVNNLKRFFKGYTTSRITTKAIDKYIAMRLEEGLSEVTVNRELAALRRMLNLGYKATPRLVADVPAITTFKEDNARQGFLEYEDFLGFLDHLPEWMRNFTRFGYFTGWRKGAISKLLWTDIDWTEQFINPPGTQSHIKSVGSVALIGEVAEILEEQRQLRMRSKTPQPTVFTNRRGTGPVKDFRKVWDTARQAVGKPRLIFHDMKRSAVRNFIRAGVSESVAMTIVGHQTNSIFKRYNITDKSDISQAFDNHRAFMETRRAPVVNIEEHRRRIRVPEGDDDA